MRGEDEARVNAAAIVAPPITSAVIVGFGKAGGSLAASLEAAGVLVHVASRGEARRARAATRHQGVVASDLTDVLTRLPPTGASALFLAVPDDTIVKVARDLPNAGALPPIVAHLSGARGREAILDAGPIEGAAAFHPLQALDGEHPISNETLIAIDGDDATASTLAALARAIGGQPARIRAGQHARYHAGAVIAGNLPVALMADAIGLLNAAGVDVDTARIALARLLESTARALQRGPLSEMLTGPVARGDAQTIARHLEHIDDAGVAARYRSLTAELLNVAPLDDSAKERIQLAIAVDAARTADDDAS